MTIANNSMERLFLYRRILQDCLDEGRTSVFSHEIGAISGASSEQVRRDLMQIGAEGSRRTGYDCASLLGALNATFRSESEISMALVGVGNLGRAVLSYFSGKKANIHMTAAFEADAFKAGRVIHGVRCHPIAEMEQVLSVAPVHVGIITVPAAAAQDVAERLVRSGVSALLNLAPVRLRVPSHCYVENLDMTLSIEKLAFLVKANVERQE